MAFLPSSRLPQTNKRAMMNCVREAGSSFNLPSGYLPDVLELAEVLKVCERELKLPNQCR